MTDSLSFIPTRSAQLKKEASNVFQAVMFEAHKGKGTGSGKPSQTSVKHDNVADEREEMDMKKVRFEVFKFGMSGFNLQKKEEAKVALALKLGAKRSTNTYHNYKEFKIIRKQQLEEEAEELMLLKVGKTAKGTSNDVKGKRKAITAKRKMAKEGILDPYGKPGEVSLNPKRRKW